MQKRKIVRRDRIIYPAADCRKTTPLAWEPHLQLLCIRGKLRPFVRFFDNLRRLQAAFFMP